MTQVLGEIHSLLGGLLRARSFYVVLVDEDRAHFRFAYFADECDASPPPLDSPMPLAQYAHTATVALLRRGRPVQGDSAQIEAELGIPLGDAPRPRAWQRPIW